MQRIGPVLQISEEEFIKYITLLDRDGARSFLKEQLLDLMV